MILLYHAAWRIAILSVFLTAALNGCRTEVVSSGNPMTGGLFGHVTQHSSGVVVRDTFVNCRGARVWVEGMQDTTLTDTDGSWKIDSLPLGTYTICFEKEGYGYSRLYSVDVLGGESSTSDVSLYRRDTNFYVLDSVRDASSSGGYYFFDFHTSYFSLGPPHSLGVILGLSRARQRLSESFDSAEVLLFASTGYIDSGRYYADLATTSVLATAIGQQLQLGDTLYASLAVAGAEFYSAEKATVEYPWHGRPTGVISFVVR